MSKGISLHIGLNQVDPTNYSGWSGKLIACEADARDMEKIARSNGYVTHSLLTSQATSQAVLSIIDDAANKLQEGDMFLFTYSGHGGQIPDTNGGDEDDGLDETWVLFDRMLVDDELYTKWSNFKQGVNIFVLSDSCHSGTVLKAMPPINTLESIYDNFAFYTSNTVDEQRNDSDDFRIVPDLVQRETYFQNQNLYRDIQAKNPQDKTSEIKASVLLISGCQDNQLSKDGVFNGLFTSRLLSVWNEGTFTGTYDQFYKEIRRRMPPIQTPNLYKVGAESQIFLTEKPFAIANNVNQEEEETLKPDTTPDTPPTNLTDETSVASTSGNGCDVSINININ